MLPCTASDELLAADDRRTPMVVTYHSDLIRQRVRGALFRPIERLVYRRVRAILPTSPLYPAGSRFLRAYADRLQVLPHGIDLEPMRTSYFISRETVVPTRGDGMWQWREHLFATMSRNAGSVVEFFKLPNNSVIELGTRVQI